MNEQPSYYAIIPASVRYDERLKGRGDEKVLFAEITALSNKYGYCYATNHYFAELYGVTHVTVSRWINHLKGLGYLKVIIVRDENNQITSRKLYPIIDPINTDVNTPLNIHDNTPINTDVKGNTTSNNTTSVNNATTTSAREKVFLCYENNIGTLSPIVVQDISMWVDDMTPEVVMEAIKRAAMEQKHWRYATAILRDWRANNITTLRQVKSNDVEFKNRQKKRYSKPKKQQGATFKPGDYTEAKKRLENNELPF